MNIGGEKKEKMAKIQILWRGIYDYLGSVQHSKINQARALAQWLNENPWDGEEDLFQLRAPQEPSVS